MSILRTKSRRRESEAPEESRDLGGREAPGYQTAEGRGTPAGRRSAAVDGPGAGPAAGEGGRFSRRRGAGAAAAATVGWGVLALARLVMAVATLIALLIVLAIVLRDVDANPRNAVVKGIREGANFFAGAFTGLITFKGHAKRELTVDWGIAAVVYLVVGALIARWIARLGRSGLRYGTRRRLAT